MKKRFSLCLATLLVFLMPAASMAITAEAKPITKDEAESPLALLKKGDPAAKVEKLLGKPLETNPMESPNGKAEVWVYVRELSRRMDQMRIAAPDTVTMVPTASGTMMRQTTPGAVQTQNVHYVREEVVEVLMFNNHYVLHKVARQERKL